VAEKYKQTLSPLEVGRESHNWTQDEFNRLGDVLNLTIDDLGEGIIEYGAAITGTGTISQAVNAFDFTGHQHADNPLFPTCLNVLTNHIPTFGYEGVAYKYIGPKPVLLGACGERVSIDADYVGTGTDDHAILVNRDATDAHPQSAITDLLTDQATQDTNLANHLADLANPHQVTEAQVINLDRVRWMGAWTAQTYVLNDWAKDSGYSAVCIAATTTDQLAPQPVGAASWLLPDAPAWTPLNLTDTIYTGIRISNLTRAFEIQKLRIWIPTITADAHYVILLKDNISGISKLGNSFDGDAFGSTGWQTVTVSPKFLLPGDDYSFILVSQNSAGDQTYNHPWVYTGSSNQEANPGTSNANRRGDYTQLRINAADRDAVSRVSELQSVIVGSTIKVTSEANASAYIEFEVFGIEDNGTWFNYQVVLLDEGAAGEPPDDDDVQIYFANPIATPTDYVELTNHFLSSATIQGEFYTGSSPTPVYNDNGYGIDITVQEYTVSPDWDLIP